MKKTLFVLVASLIAGLLPASSAVAAPAIAFVNPSPVAAGVPELSDKGGNAVHLVAWASEIPSSPLVEFEIRGTVGTLTAPHNATIDAQRVGTSDTWEAFFTIPDSFSDGTYTLSARLYSNLQQVAEFDQLVTVNQSNLPPPDPADTVELTLPSNGGPLGFFTPKEKATNTVITAVASSGTDQVRALYTMSDPGQTPEWDQCGTGSPGDGGVTTIRCVLAEGDSPAGVTAVAVVANQTPVPAPADPAADDAADAHRIQPYVQAPTFIGISPQSQQAASGTCHLMTATLFDQMSRPIAAANIDVHGQGPNDQLTFATVNPTPITTTTHPYQEPEGHVSGKPTIRCSDETQIETRQGVHRAIGSPDRMHIESVNGTNNSGSFVFALYSPSSGPTNVTAWADVNDDDSQGVSEASGQGQIGWDEAPPPPKQEIFIDPDTSSADVGTCKSLTVVVREGNSPVVGQNIDIHATGPDASVSFCNPPGANVTRRDPDQGGHVAGSHTDSNAKHAEGETDETGRFVFGVSAASEGRTNIVAWIDDNDDDVQGTTEAAAPAHVTFDVEGDRSVSLEKNRNRVRKGRRVRLTGSIDGSAFCEANQTVKLKARRPNARWRNIATKTTAEDGSFRFRPKVFKTKDYRVIAPKDGSCERAGSRRVRVRVRG